jgi:hypothetical protein
VKVGCVRVSVLRFFSSISKFVVGGRFAMTKSILFVHLTITLKTKSEFITFDLGSVAVTLTKYEPVALYVFSKMFTVFVPSNVIAAGRLLPFCKVTAEMTSS